MLRPSTVRCDREMEESMPATETTHPTPRPSAVIDDALIRFRNRNLLSGTEVVDFLLDLRLVIDREPRVDALVVAGPS
jgi:hypothetical protein